MPTTYFFATKADLTPGLEALRRERPLQFVRCTTGGWLDGPQVPIYTSLLDATDLDRLQYVTWPVARSIQRLDLIAIFVLDADAAVSVEEHRTGKALPHGGTIRYQIEIPEDAPSVLLTPGGLHESSGVLWCGELQAGYTDAEEIRLYRLMVERLFSGFKPFGGYLYGPGALALGAQGVRYAWMESEPYKPWTYDDLLQSEQNVRALPAKPEHGRLSLEETWNRLEASGYEAPRNADGTPRPYRRRPSYDDDSDEGLSFFRTFIDDEELDRLTMPRTYIGKSRAYQTSFRRSDLSGSRFAANHVAYCDFTESDLSRAHLSSYFLGCTFEAARMSGAKLLYEQGQRIPLSETQRSEIAWCSDAGREPEEF